MAFIPEEKGKLWSIMEKSDLFPLSGNKDGAAMFEGGEKYQDSLF